MRRTIATLVAWYTGAITRAWLLRHGTASWAAALLGWAAGAFASAAVLGG